MLKRSREVQKTEVGEFMIALRKDGEGGPAGQHNCTKGIIELVTVFELDEGSVGLREEDGQGTTHNGREHRGFMGRFRTGQAADGEL